MHVDMVGAEHGPWHAAPPRPLHCFVHSPLAYICARELISKCEATEAHLYIIASSRSGAKMLDSLAREDDWKSSETLMRGREGGFLGKAVALFDLVFCALRLRWLVGRIGRGGRVVLCHLANPYSRLICSILRQKNAEDLVTVVDDGTTTLVEHAALTEHGAITIGNSAQRARNLFSRLESLLLSTAPIPARQVEFFSVWRLPGVPLFDGPKVAPRNDLAMLHSKVVARPKRRVVYFIGQPFVRRALLSSDAYAEVISRIRKHYAERGFEFRYFCHRNEANDLRIDGVEISRVEQPFELFLLSESEWPQIIAGFYSACILTSRFLFKDQFKYEVFWGFPALGPEVGTFMAVADAFRAECAQGDSLTINFRLGVEQ